MSLPERFRSADGHLDGGRCVFVVGAPRSGTTWLQRMIEAHPGVAAIPQELTLFSRYIAPVVKGYDLESANMAQDRWSQGLPLLWSGEEFHQRVRGALTDAYARVIERNPNAVILLDKHPGYCYHLPLIERFLPGSRIIHIIRDGREVAVSMLSARQRIGFGADTIEGCAQEWCTSVLAAQAQGKALGDSRYLELRYERLVENAEVELARVLAFCGLDTGADHVRAITEAHHISRKAVSSGDPQMQRLREHKGESWSTKLDLRQRYLFHRMAGALLIRSGYGQAGWWALSAGDRLRMALYPLRVRLGASWRALQRIWTTPIARAIKP